MCNMGSRNSQITRLVMRCVIPVPDEMMDGFHDCNGKPVCVLIEFSLRDQPAAASGIEIHHLHHVAQVGLQTAVLFLVVLNQLDKYFFLDAHIPRCLAPITFFEQGFLSLEESSSFGF